MFLLLPQDVFLLLITNLDSSKASGPDCIPLVVTKNCDCELSYILAELLNMCLNKSCFPDCWKVSSVAPVFLKGYVPYKMITSQNVSSVAQVKIFLFRRKVILCSQDIQVFVFLTIP